MPQSFSILLLDSDGKAIRIGIDDLIAAGQQSESRWRLDIEGAEFDQLLFAFFRSDDGRVMLDPAILFLILRMLMNPPQEKDFRIEGDGIGLIVEGSLARELDYPPHLRPRLVLRESGGGVYASYPGVPISETGWGMKWLRSLFSDDLNIVQPVAVMARRDEAVEVLHLRGGDAVDSVAIKEDLLSLFFMLANSAYGGSVFEPALYALEEIYVEWLMGQDPRMALWRLAGDYILLSGTWHAGDRIYLEKKQEIMSSDAAARFYEARINGRWAGVPLSIVPQRHNPETGEIAVPARTASTLALLEIVSLIRAGKSMADSPEGSEPPRPEWMNKVPAHTGLIALTRIGTDRMDSVSLRAGVVAPRAVHLVSGNGLRIYTSFRGENVSEVTGEFFEWLVKNDEIFRDLLDQGY